MLDASWEFFLYIEFGTILINETRFKNLEKWIMVNLNIYDEYAHQHKQYLVHAAQLGRDLHQHRNKCRGRNQNPDVITAGLRKRILRITWWDSGKDRDRARIKSHLAIE